MRRLERAARDARDREANPSVWALAEAYQAKHTPEERDRLYREHIGEPAADW